MGYSNGEEVEDLAAMLKGKLAFLKVGIFAPFWAQRLVNPEDNGWLTSNARVVRPIWNRIVDSLREEGYSAVRARMSDLEDDIEQLSSAKARDEGNLQLYNFALVAIRSLMNEHDVKPETPVGLTAWLMYQSLSGSLWSEYLGQGWTVECDNFIRHDSEFSKPLRYGLRFEPTDEMIKVAGLEGVVGDRRGGFFSFGFKPEQTWAQVIEQVLRRARPTKDSLEMTKRAVELAWFQYRLVGEVLRHERLLGWVPRMTKAEKSLIRLPFKEPKLRPKTHGNQRWHMFDEFVLNWEAELSLLLDKQGDIASAIDQRLHDEFAAELEQQGMTDSIFDERQLRFARDRHRREREHDSHTK